MGRRNRRVERRTAVRDPVARAPVEDVDGAWHVRTITSARASKAYRCPGCQQEIRPGTAHVVAWPADRPEGEECRRHWHSPCWRSRDRRRPWV